MTKTPRQRRKKPVSATTLHAAQPTIEPRRARADVLTEILADDIQSRLAAEEWSLASRQRAGLHHILALERGAGVIAGRGGVTSFTAPAVALAPGGSADSLTIEAGSTGRLLALSDATLGRGMLSSPELQPLWRGLQAGAPLSVGGDAQAVSVIADCVSRIAAEISHRQAGAALAALSNATIVFVTLSRMMTANFLVDPTRNAADLLPRFRRLIDEHLRERWSVAQFARALGVSPDRLHDVCRRKLGRTPSQLIQECILQTADGILERREVPIKQVSFLLGFKDPTYFNRFFRRHMKLPPGLYRQRYAGGGDGAITAQRRTFADWP